METEAAAGVKDKLRVIRSPRGQERDGDKFSPRVSRRTSTTDTSILDVWFPELSGDTLFFESHQVCDECVTGALGNECIR